MRISDAALIFAVTLSDRYISDRFLPDKAIDLMDEAASALRMAIDSKPEELDSLDRKILQLKIEREALKKKKTSNQKNVCRKSKMILLMKKKKQSDYPKMVFAKTGSC